MTKKPLSHLRDDFSDLSPLDLQFRRSEKTEKLFAALIKVKQDIGTEIVVHDSVNPHFRNRFASLNACLELINPHLYENGLFLSQWPTGTHLINHLSHTSGQFVESAYKLNPVKNDPQGVGSAITYSRRYSICAIFSFSGGEDDDGEMAQGESPPKSARSGNSGNGNNAPRKDSPAAKLSASLDEEYSGTPKQIVDAVWKKHDFKTKADYDSFLQDGWQKLLRNFDAEHRKEIAKEFSVRQTTLKS